MAGFQPSTNGRFWVSTEERGREVFEKGSLQWPDAGITLHRAHNQRSPIMLVRPEVRGLDVILDAQLPDTQSGRDTAAEVRSGLLTGLSVEFQAQGQVVRAGVRRISRAALIGAGLVTSASYPAASGVEVRGQGMRRGVGRRLWL